MIRTIGDLFLSVLSHKFFPAVLLFLVLPLAWPLIHSGWFSDDIYQRAAYVDTPDARERQPLGRPLVGPMRMYSFFDGDSERFQRMLDYGNIPWWYSPDMRAALWRPITALFSSLDYWLWPESSESMHVHSLGWFAVLIVVSGLVYRNVMGPGWAAGLALLLYTISDIQVIPIAFLANRHILTAAAFGVGAIGTYDRWREERRMGWIVVSCILYALSLFASESGIAVFGYAMSYSLWLERGTVWERIKPLFPFVFITVVWRVIYKSLGYGISGVELYVDPGNEPFQFVQAVIFKGPALFLHSLAFPPSDIVIIASIVKVYWVSIAFVLIFYGFLFLPLYRRDRISLFWLFGSLFAVIPLCAAVPGGRSLALASFGATGFLSRIVCNIVQGKGALFPAKTWRILTIAVLAVLILVRLLVGSYTLNQTHKLLQTAQRGITALSSLPFDDPDLVHHDVILVNPPVTIFTVYTIPCRLIERKPLPAHFRTLCSGVDPIEMKRTGEKTLVVRPDGGYMRPPEWDRASITKLWSRDTVVNSLRFVERIFRKRDNPFTLGQTFELPGVTVCVTELSEDNRPMEATFVFERALEDGSLRWLQWNKKRWKYESFRPPGIGETVTLE